MVDTPTPVHSEEDIYIKDINGNLTPLKVGSIYKIVNIENKTILTVDTNDSGALISKKEIHYSTSARELFTLIPIGDDGYIIKNIANKKVITCSLKKGPPHPAILIYDCGYFINDQVINLIPHEDYKGSYIIQLKKNKYELNVCGANENYEKYDMVFREPNKMYIAHILFNFTNPVQYFSTYKYQKDN